MNSSVIWVMAAHQTKLYKSKAHVPHFLPAGLWSHAELRSGFLIHLCRSLSHNISSSKAVVHDAVFGDGEAGLCQGEKAADLESLGARGKPEGLGVKGCAPELF